MPHNSNVDYKSIPKNWLATAMGEGMNLDISNQGKYARASDARMSALEKKLKGKKHGNDE